MKWHAETLSFSTTLGAARALLPACRPHPDGQFPFGSTLAAPLRSEFGTARSPINPEFDSLVALPARRPCGTLCRVPQVWQLRIGRQALRWDIPPVAPGRRELSAVSGLR